MHSVVVDLSRIREPHCGLGQFALNLGRALQECRDGQVRPVFLVPGSAISGDFSNDTIRMRPWQKEPVRRLLRPWHAACQTGATCDLWHTTDHLSSYAPAHPGTPVILTIHDLNFLAERSGSSARRSLRKLQSRVDRAAELTTGSHFAARQIQEHLDLRGKKIHVIYHGVCLKLTTVAIRPRFSVPGRFLLSIGVFRPSKNLHVLIDFMREVPDRALILAGNHATEYGAQVRAAVQAAGLENRVLLPGVVSDEERLWLYQTCEAFLFPSTAEGFGLPVIEAMSFGRPVFLAAETSLPEIAGPHGFYWSTFEPREMARVFHEGMTAAAADPGFASRLMQHAGAFTWERAAARYMELYRDVIGANRPRARCA
jgi:glycosyltransferase involved in cell wall biosynthesis